MRLQLLQQTLRLRIARRGCDEAARVTERAFAFAGIPTETRTGQQQIALRWMQGKRTVDFRERL